jgi:hypothetical protein
MVDTWFQEDLTNESTVINIVISSWPYLFIITVILRGRSVREESHGPPPPKSIYDMTLLECHNDYHRFTGIKDDVHGLQL